MYLELENQLENIAVIVAKQQVGSFSSQRAAHLYLEKTKADIRQILKQSSPLLIKGLSYLTENDQGQAHSYVAGVSAKLLKHVDSSKKFNRIVESEIWTNDYSLTHFTEVLDEYIDCGDIDKEECLIGTVLALFPLNPQPYIYLGSLVSRKNGVEDAAAYYAKITEVIQNPALYYFAAECFYQNRDKDQAKKYYIARLN
jgi:hypothetical protein